MLDNMFRCIIYIYKLQLDLNDYLILNVVE